MAEAHTIIIEALDEAISGTARLPSPELEVHVAGGTPGDELVIALEHTSRHRPQGWGRIVEVVARGPSFVEPPCPHAAPLRGACGGCPAQHVAYDAQLAAKRAAVERALAPLVATGHAAPGAVHAAPQPLGYRNRSNYVVGRAPARGLGGRKVARQVRLGSFAPRSHVLARMDGCLAVRPALRRAALALEALLTRLEVPVGDESSDALRYVVLRANDKDEVLVEAIARDPAPGWLRALLVEVAALPDVVGMTLSVNDRADNALAGEDPVLLGGRATVLEQVGSVVLEAPASGFLQLNSEVAASMYGAAAAWLAAREVQPRVVWDLYCGAGGLGQTVAHALDSVETVCGSEVYEGALALARENARRNGVRDARYAVVDLRSEWPADWPAPDAVLVNPPRRGIDAAVVARLAALPASVPLIYMSCSAQSFARDVALLCEGGARRLARVEAWDMLPQTSHVELLGLVAEALPPRSE